MTRVLPLPAPARISKGPSLCSTARRCWGLRSSRRLNMLIGLAGDPLKKNPGLLKQNSTRTSQDSQRKPSVLSSIVGDLFGMRNDLCWRAIRSESGARSGSVFHFRQNALGRFARIGVSRYGTTDNEIIRPRNDRLSRSDPSLLVVGEEALGSDTRRYD